MIEKNDLSTSNLIDMIRRTRGLNMNISHPNKILAMMSI